MDARSALVDASQALADAKFVPSGSAVSVGDASSIAVSPDGGLIVTGNRDGSISTWKATGNRLASSVPGHTKAIEEMDFTPDGRWLVTGSDDTTVLLWDLADPADVPPPTVLGQTGEIVWSVAVAPDGGTVATASEDGTIQLWDLGARREVGAPLADLEPEEATRCEWIAGDDAVILIYTGIDPPVLFARGDPSQFGRLSQQVPPATYTFTLLGVHRAALAERLRPEREQRMWRMVAKTVDFAETSDERARPLGPADLPAIQELFATHPDRPDAFHPRQLLSGPFFGVWDGASLVSVAGTQWPRWGMFSLDPTAAGRDSPRWRAQPSSMN